MDQECVLKVIPFVTRSWGAQAAFLPGEAKLKDALQGHGSMLQPEMDTESIGSHDRQSELNHSEVPAVRMSGPLYQLFGSFVPAVLLYRSKPPEPHYLPRSVLNIADYYTDQIATRPSSGAFTLAPP